MPQSNLGALPPVLPDLPRDIFGSKNNDLVTLTCDFPYTVQAGTPMAVVEETIRFFREEFVQKRGSSFL